jgi:CheY-like chemotaxis protein
MEALGQLTGGVAHDFNNLLTIILGNIERARGRSNVIDGAVKTMLDRAYEGASRAATLTQRLLAFSRQQPLDPAAVECNRLVSGMSEMLHRTLGEDIAIETVLSGGLWRALADPNQLESAILNLAVNARDAMPKGGKLTIEISNAYLDEAYARRQPDVTPGQYVSIAVTDTGTGMSPEVKAKAFDPFFTTKPTDQGTGLGLSQVYGFVKQSGGHVAIYSELGQGTTVKIYLPRAQGNAGPDAGTAEASDPALAASGDGRTILVVEDDAMVRRVSVDILEDAGYHVLSSSSADRALALLRSNEDIWMLFSDVVLGSSMNGRQLADEAVKLRPNLKLLFTTGYSRNAIVHHGRLDAGTNLIVKPFTAADLLAKVNSLLR